MGSSPKKTISTKRPIIYVFPKENVAGQAGNISDKIVKFTIFEDIQREVYHSLMKIGAGVAVLFGTGLYLYL